MMRLSCVVGTAAALLLLLACGSASFEPASDAGSSADAAPPSDAGDAGNARDAGASNKDAAASSSVAFRDFALLPDGSGTAFDLGAPPLAVSGDLLLAIFATDSDGDLPASDTDVVTPPTGFTNVAEQDFACEGDGWQLHIFSGVRASGDPPPYHFSLAVTANYSGVMLAYAGASPAGVSVKQSSSYPPQASFDIDAVASVPSGYALIAAAMVYFPWTTAPASTVTRATFGTGKGYVGDVISPSSGMAPLRSLVGSGTTCSDVIQLFVTPTP